MTFAVDMLAQTISPQAIKAAGYVAVNRYLRNLTIAEIQGYLAAGLGVATIFETSATESLGGAAAGAADGRTALAQATSLGQPTGTLLWVNLADFAPPPSDIPVIQIYLSYFRLACPGYQVGGYGTGYVIDQLVLAGVDGPWWQNAEDDSGWPGTQLQAQASMYQDVQTTLPQIAGTRPGDYDQDPILGPLNWWTTTSPEPPLPARLLGHPRQEMQMYAWDIAPDGVRKDCVWVDPASCAVWHGFSKTGDLTKLDFKENLGGAAVGVTCGWEQNGNFTITAQGRPDNQINIRVWSNSQNAWLDDWTPSGVIVHAPV